MKKFLTCLFACCLVFACLGCSAEEEGDPKPIPGLELDVPGFDDPDDADKQSGDAAAEKPGDKAGDKAPK